jgi:hypothetical protein
MVRPRGISNKRAFSDLGNSFSGSGIMRSRVVNGETIFDVNGPVAQLQKNQALVHGAGRLTILKGSYYIPAYTVGIGAPVGSGYTVPSNGIYQVDGVVSVSGVAIEKYAGAVLVNGVAASGTQSYSPADALGAAAVKINGIVHAVAGQVINLGVKTLHGNLTTIGSEDLVHAPAANMRVVKLGSDELAFNQ